MSCSSSEIDEFGAPQTTKRKKELDKKDAKKKKKVKKVDLVVDHGVVVDPIPQVVIDYISSQTNSSSDGSGSPSLRRIASWDVGKKNLAFVVEEYNEDELRELGTTGFLQSATFKQEIDRMKSEGEIPENFTIENITRRYIYTTSKRIYTGVYELSDFREFPELGDVEGVEGWWMGDKYNFENEEVPMELELINLLGKWEWLWETVNEVIIEMQFMSVNAKSGVKPNFKAIAVAQTLKTYFHMKFGSERRVSFVPSTWKTYNLGQRLRLDKPKRKAWCTEHTRRLYILRGDEDVGIVYQAKEYLFRKRMSDVDNIIKNLKRFLKDKRFCDKSCLEPIISLIQQYNSSSTSELAVGLYSFIEREVNTKSFLQNDVARLIIQVFFYRQKLDDISDVVCQLQAWKYKKYFM